MKHSESKKKPLNKAVIFKFFLAVLAICGLVWGLVYAFTPKSNLEPYDKYKEMETTKETAKDAKNEPSKKDTSPSLADSSLSSEEIGIKNKIKQISDQSKSPSTDSAQALVSREALEHVSKGMQLTEKGQYGSADLEFEKAAEISPNSPEVFAIWATALRMQGKFKGANTRFAKALELAPNDDEIIFNWGMSRLMEKNADEAIKLFKKTVELKPDHFLAYNNLGKAYGQKKMYAEEELSYRKAIEINPDFGRSYFNLGIVMSLQKKFEPAADYFEKAIAIDKEFEKPFVIQLLTAMGRKTSMKSAKLKKSEATPKDPSGIKPAEKKPEEKHDHDSHEHEAKPEEEKKAEGSDHKMEEGSSKITNKITKITGKVTINGGVVDSKGLVMLETKTKLKAPGQKVLNVTISQKDLGFLPQHTIVPVGSTISFVNNDIEIHNIFSKSLNNQFNLGAMAAGWSKEIKMNTAGPVILRCNLHKDMVGTVFVVPNGYYAKSNDNGEFVFEDVKSADYIMQVWHPRLYPEEVLAHAKEISLTGEDKVLNLEIKSESKAGEIHDLIDETDYNLIVDNIEKEMNQAIEDWKNGKKFIPRKRMLMAITKHYEGEGLKGAIAKSFSTKRSEKLEQSLDSIRKKISGIDKSEEITEDSLKRQANLVVAQLRRNVTELEGRLKPAKP